MSFTKGGYSVEAGPPAPVTLSAAQRAAVRLRLRRALDRTYEAASNPYSFYGFGSPESRPEGAEGYVLQGTGFHHGRGGDAAYGVALRAEVPNRLKRGHLDFDSPALAAPVPLPGAATLCEVVKRVSQVTRVELYADARVAGLPVFF